MKHSKSLFFCLAVMAAAIAMQAQSPVGKSFHDVIGLRGENYKRLADAEGLHILQYKRPLGKDTICDFIYLQGFTCVKQVSLRPMAQKQLYTDSLNRFCVPAGYNSWRDKDSSFITMATRDGYLDITSFSAAYYKKISH